MAGSVDVEHGVHVRLADVQLSSYLVILWKITEALLHYQQAGNSMRTWLYGVVHCHTMAQLPERCIEVYGDNHKLGSKMSISHAIRVAGTLPTINIQMARVLCTLSRRGMMVVHVNVILPATVDAIQSFLSTCKSCLDIGLCRSGYHTELHYHTNYHYP